MNDVLFEDGLKHRLSFWEKWMPPDSPFAEFRDLRLKAGREVPPWLIKYLPKGIDRPAVLDLNAGPFSMLGTRVEGRDMDLVAIDYLAYSFKDLLKQHNLTAPVPTEFCAAEDILCTFGKNRFHLIYSFNGFSNTRDPIDVYAQCLECLVKGGTLVTFNEPSPDYRQLHKKPYSWFHAIEGNRLQIVNKGYRRDLHDALPKASINIIEEGDMIRVEIKHRKRPSRFRLKSQSMTGEKRLPRLLSMHIPKTAGSSFRRFLEATYGDGLRCLYSPEVTDPKRASQLDLPPSIRCLHGHFQADAYADQFKNAKMITWLRDPVERVVSSYYQYHRWPPESDGTPFYKGIFERGWRILDFARSDEMVKQVRWYFNAVPMDKFFFIGITEQYDMSLKVLCHLLNISVPEELENRNINPSRKDFKRYLLPESMRKEIEALYSAEYELYERALGNLRNTYKKVLAEEGEEIEDNLSIANSAQKSAPMLAGEAGVQD